MKGQNEALLKQSFELHVMLRAQGAVQVVESFYRSYRDLLDEAQAERKEDGGGIDG